MRMEAAQHVAHHAGAFDRLGTAVAVGPAKAQAHARHAVQNAPLHRLLAVAHIGQRPALDHAQRVFKVGALGVGSQAILVGRFGACGLGAGGEKIVHEAFKLQNNLRRSGAQNVRSNRAGAQDVARNNFPIWPEESGCDVRRETRSVASHTNGLQRSSAPESDRRNGGIVSCHILSPANAQTRAGRVLRQRWAPCCCGLGPCHPSFPCAPGRQRTSCWAA